MTCFYFLRPPAAWLLGAGLLGGLAQAQSPATPIAPPVDALIYRSELTGYQPYREQPVQPWRETNDTVARIGGWRAYAREAADATRMQDQPASGVPTPTPTPAPASPAPDPHAGHHGAKP